MSRSLTQEEVQQQVREKLNKDKVKLWLPPYTLENGSKGDHPQELVRRYAAELGQDEGIISDILEELRVHALEKLAARKKLQDTGIATFKIKLAGNVPQQVKQTNNSTFTLELSIQQTGEDLKQKICDHINIQTLCLKLITSGRVIDDNAPLQQQNINIKNGLIMAVCLSESEAEARRKEDERMSVAKTRQAAELLSSKEDGGDDDNGNYYLKVADQTGKPIDLPHAERKALTLAMTLHEKGKIAMKKKDYGEALLLLLEADKEFSNCRATILDAVDNFAILCLDIVWCYLCLKNINHLPDAERRLQSCDDCFRKSYGPNLERLAIIKGGTGTEKALFMRLHLLQGIVAFHQGQRDKALALLSRAETELKLLEINEDSMTQVMAMGFSQLEARLALRACEGNVTLAISHIMKRKEDREERKRREKEEKDKKKLERKLGKTANGSAVNTETYKQLISMGFNKGAAAQALRQSNNDITLSLQVLQDNPELLNLPDPDCDDTKITDDMIAQVTALGFSIESARATLHRYHGEIQTAVEELLKCDGMIPQEWLDVAMASSSSSSGSSSSSSESTSPTKSAEERKREKEAIDALVTDLPRDEEEHLDIVLDEEAQFLAEYKSLMQTAHT